MIEPFGAWKLTLHLFRSWLFSLSVLRSVVLDWTAATTPNYLGLCKTLGWSIDTQLYRPLSICMSYSKWGLTLNKCAKYSRREQQDMFVWIEGCDYIFPLNGSERHFSAFILLEVIWYSFCVVTPSKEINIFISVFPLSFFPPLSLFPNPHTLQILLLCFCLHLFENNC